MVALTRLFQKQDQYYQDYHRQQEQKRHEEEMRRKQEALKQMYPYQQAQEKAYNQVGKSNTAAMAKALFG